MDNNSKNKNKIYGIAYKENDLRKYEHLAYQVGRTLFYEGVDFIELVRNYLPQLKLNPRNIENLMGKIKRQDRRSFLMDLFLPGYSFDDNLDFEYMCFLGYTEAFNNVEEKYVCIEYYCSENNIKNSYDIIDKIMKNNSNDIDEIHSRVHFIKKDILKKYISFSDNLEIVFIRHGKPDYRCCEESGFVGQGYNLAPLSEEGIDQAERVSLEGDFKNCDLIISSPYTRALQTAAIISKNTGINIKVETDLHEWLPDKNYKYETNNEFYSKYKDFIKNKGIYPAGEIKSWETIKEMKDRIKKVLEKYTSYKKI